MTAAEIVNRPSDKHFARSGLTKDQDAGLSGRYNLDLPEYAPHGATSPNEFSVELIYQLRRAFYGHLN